MPAVYEPLLMLHRGMPFGEVLRMTLLGNHERLSAARALEIGPYVGRANSVPTQPIPDAVSTDGGPAGVRPQGGTQQR